MTYPWGHSRRFNAYSNYFKMKFGARVQKLTIDAGFTCPNRDGTISAGGCTYCNNNAFNPSYCHPSKTIKQQIQEGIEFHRNRYRKAEKFLAYFQAYSNTYASIEKLKEAYTHAVRHKDVIGLVIGTRPDCIDDEKLDLLAEFSRNYYVTMEYGLESCYNQTLERINRGHTMEQSIEALQKTAKRRIKTGIHLIFGLPGEDVRDMLDEAAIISKLPIHTVKFHQMQILKKTRMAKEYSKYPERFNLFSLEDYLNFMVHFVERMNPDFYIERFSAEVPPQYLIAPDWGLIRNFQVLHKLERKLQDLDTWQGKLYNIS